MEVKIMRKKITAAVLIAAMAMMAVGCGKEDNATTASTTVDVIHKVDSTQNEKATIQVEESSEVETEADPSGNEMVGNQISGGWEKAASPAITPELKALVEKAGAGLTGATYDPVALIGTQVVAGKNYCLLCKQTPVVPDAKPVYSLVTIYEDLEENASFSNIAASTVQAPTEQLAGGITEAGPELTAEAKTALEEATATLTGESYDPLVLLGTQVVAGTNYYILCECTYSDQNATAFYAIVTVYAGVDGTRSIIDEALFQ